jgi:vacuolar-type H+-ATPase subunit I/STV1
METKNVAKKEWWKGRWKIGKERKKLEQQLETLEATDDKHKSALDAIEQTTKIRNMNIETALKVATGIGGLLLAIYVGKASVEIDHSGEISHNRTSQGFFNKLPRMF